jgi:chromate reductase
MLPPDVSFELYRDLGAIPAYNEDVDNSSEPEAVADIRAALRAADAVLISTPEYNFSLPGQLKNALDWVSRPLADNPLQGKPVAVVGASRGLFGAVWAQAETRKVLGALKANVLEDELPVGLSDQAFAANGQVKDPQLQTRLQEIVDKLVLAAATNAFDEAAEVVVAV